MAKNQPVWKMLNQPEPPIVDGYWDYGQVYCPVRDGRPSARENRREDIRQCLASYRMWGRKIRSQIPWIVRHHLGLHPKG